MRRSELGQAALSPRCSRGKNWLRPARLPVFKGSSDSGITRRLAPGLPLGVTPAATGQPWLSGTFHLAEKWFWCFFHFSPPRQPCPRICLPGRAVGAELLVSSIPCPGLTPRSAELPRLCCLPRLSCVASAAGVSQLSCSLPSFLTGLGNTPLLQRGLSACSSERFGLLRPRDPRAAVARGAGTSSSRQR